MKKLSLNVDHVATLREARKGSFPDPVAAALIAEQWGADSITTHLREDRRHIQDRDVEMISKLIQTSLNLEMAATEEMLKIAYSIRPKMVTLVPEKREEITTEGGLDLILAKDHLTQFVKNLHSSNIKVSLFIDPDIDMIKVAHKINADIIELHTGSYANAISDQDKYKELLKIIDSAKTASRLGMRVHVGHGINYHNVAELAQIDEIEEFAIGHSIISQAVFVGLPQAVKEMKSAINSKTK
ncbi:pyridoxine 5'-phosphate synthase [bacterium]|nr:pyridoxine 5'-phosphate synthase [bacterium]